MSCQVASCSTCKVYKSLADLCHIEKEVRIPYNLPKNFESRHFFFTTFSAPLDFAYRMYFYTVRLFIVVFKPELYYQELGFAAVPHYFLGIASVINEMFSSLKYTIVVCALTGDAFHDREGAAVRLLTLYGRLNNGLLSDKTSFSNNRYILEKQRAVNWWRLPFEASKCSSTPFSYIHVFGDEEPEES
jgi:hypothetical protein